MTPTPLPNPGSSIKILGPYLENRIDVLVDYGDGHPAERAQLLGAQLPEEGVSAGEAIRVKFYRDGKRTWLDPKHVRPILRCFDDLLTPLADTTIPAVEVVRNLYPKEENIRAKLVGNWLEINSDRTLLYYFWQEDLAQSKLSFWAAEYLRSHQFAVGMKPEQFIPYYPRAITS